MIALFEETMADELNHAGVSVGNLGELNKDNRVTCFMGNFTSEKQVDRGYLGIFITEANPTFQGVPSVRYEVVCACSSVAINVVATNIRADDYLAELFITRKKETVSIGRFQPALERWLMRH